MLLFLEVWVALRLEIKERSFVLLGEYLLGVLRLTDLHLEENNTSYEYSEPFLWVPIFSYNSPI